MLHGQTNIKLSH